MATGTISSIFARGELRRVRILMATQALQRGGAEIDIFQINLKGWWMMAFCTGQAAVRPCEWKLGFRMIEAL